MAFCHPGSKLRRALIMMGKARGFASKTKVPVLLRAEVSECNVTMPPCGIFHKPYLLGRKRLGAFGAAQDLTVDGCDLLIAEATTYFLGPFGGVWSCHENIAIGLWEPRAR
ncbi:unnamed protein product, partial [Clonostachys rhizophaga]